jgi:hypothetical protein
MIRTPDQRLRVFVSSIVGERGELAAERRVVERAISALRLTPVMFELERGRTRRSGADLGREVEPAGHPDRGAEAQVAVEGLGVGRVEPDTAVAGGLLVDLVAGDPV